MLEVLNPATEEVVERLEPATEGDADAAVARARGAYPAWRDVEPADRSRLLRRLADALDAEHENLSQLESKNTGKPIGDSRGEMGMVAETFYYYAGMPERLLGDTIPVSRGVDVTFREPLGVVGLIVPWNFPLTIASWKMAPALAAGNTLVLKPAELTPLTALEFGAHSAGGRHPRGRHQRRREERLRRVPHPDGACRYGHEGRGPVRRGDGDVFLDLRRPPREGRRIR